MSVHSSGAPICIAIAMVAIALLSCQLTEAVRPITHNLKLQSLPSYRQHIVSVYSRPNESTIEREGDVLPALFVRGGETRSLVPDEDDDASFVLVKVRNVIRGLLNIGDKNVPIFSSVLRSGMKVVESLTGLRLLPKPKPIKKDKKKKKSSSKKKKKKQEKESENDEESSADEDKEESEEDGEEKTAAKKEKKREKALAKARKPSATTKKHLSTSMKSNNPNFRVQRELKEFLAEPPPNLSVQVGSNIRIWIVTMVGAKNTIYEGEVFKLRIQFPKEYPIVPPSVYFLQGHVPTHEHVYTNGDICLSLLGKGWRPTMTAQSIAVSILSILSSAQSKSLPMDNARHAGNKPGQYQKDWVYHDDNC